MSPPPRGVFEQNTLQKFKCPGRLLRGLLGRYVEASNWSIHKYVNSDHLLLKAFLTQFPSISQLFKKKLNTETEVEKPFFSEKNVNVLQKKNNILTRDLS